MSIRSRFFKLLVGPVVAALAGLLSGPVISYLYSPEEFGHYSVLAGVVGVCAVLVTLRFEQLLPTSQDQSSNIWLALVFTALGCVFITVIGLSVATIYETAFIALATSAIAVFNSFYYKLIADDRAMQASVGRSVQAVGVLGGQASFGFYGLGLYGLLLGELVGRFFSLGFVVRKVDIRTYATLKASLVDQWSDARWLLPTSLIGALSLQLLPIGLSFSLGAREAGIFLLAYRLVAIPNTLVSKVIGDSILVELGKLKGNSQSISELMEACLKRLLLVATTVYGLLAIYGGILFQLAFSAEWREASYLVPWFALFVAGWFIAAPMATIFIAMRKTKWSLGLSCIDILNRAFSLLVGFVSESFVSTAVSLAIGGVIVYGLSVVVSARISNSSVVRSLMLIASDLLIVSIILVLAYLFLNNGYLWASLVISSCLVVVILRKVVYG